MTGSEAVPQAQASGLSMLLIEEISHRVVNEYAQAVAAVRQIAASARSGEARAALAKVSDRLCDFAAAHRALLRPRDTVAIDVAGYFEDLCRALTASMLRERGILLSLTAESACVAPERCWKLGLIVAELITNAARHGLRGGGGAILVWVEPVGDLLACRVVDNGGASQRPVPSRGSVVVERLAEELGGEVRWYFGASGTRVEVAIPIDSSLLA